MDGIFISTILNAIFKKFFHNSITFRVLKVFLGIPLGILYLFYALYIDTSEDTSMAFGGLIIFGPLILALLLIIVLYIKNGN